MRSAFICLLIIVANILGKPDDEEEINFDERRVIQEAEIIDALLNGYNPKVRPIGNILYEGFHRPVVVTVNMHIISLKRVDDIKMEYDLQLFLRQKWRDDRLTYAKEGPDVVTLRDNHKIWTPDTFFGNEDEAHRHMLDQPNTLIHIERDGSVIYSTRLSMTLFCPMDFTKLPFDTQTCNFTIESYAYTEDDIVYIWDNEIAIKYDASYMTLPLFEISNITFEGKSVRVKERTYSNIQAVFHLRRKLGYYFYHFYLPTAMLVIASWTAFFLHPSKATARTFIGLGTLALLTLFSALFNSDLPKTSYAKALDVWSGTMLLFVFLSFIESVLISYLHSAQHECCDALISDPEEQLITPATKWNARKRRKSLICRIYDLFKGQTRKMDVLSRFVFPAMFAIFALIYFTVCWLL